MRDARYNRYWYEGVSPPWWARALSVLFSLLVVVRLALYRSGVLRRFHPGVPVIVVGNLVAGGAGKTPLTVALVGELQRQGYRVGVVSRGYGAQTGKQPLIVDEKSRAAQVGDEPLLIARRTGAAVCVHPRRARAAQTLMQNCQLDLLLCDDGLQHYALARDMEIVVIDGARGLGNRRLLPAGPLREPVSRLRTSTHIVINGALSAGARSTLPRSAVESASNMQLVPSALINLRTRERCVPQALTGTRVVAVAGIGNPQRFFETLGELGYAAECRAFPDHHGFVAADFSFAGERPVLMTEKDAVKCVTFAKDDWWYLETGAVLQPDFVEAFVRQVAKLTGRQPTEKLK